MAVDPIAARAPVAPAAAPASAGSSERHTQGRPAEGGDRAVFSQKARELAKRGEAAGEDAGPKLRLSPEELRRLVSDEGK